MIRVLLLGMILLFTGKGICSPWDDDYTYATFDHGQAAYYTNADIQNNRVISMESRLSRQEGRRNTGELSRMLLLFSGVVGIVAAGRHIRRR